MIDVHAHLTEFQNISEIIKRAKDAGLECIIVSITEPSEIKRAKEIVSQHPGFLLLTIGFDPTILSEEEFSKFESLVESESIIGIGEVGLDHYYIRDEKQRKVQEEFFRRSIRLALRKSLPLIVHSRSAGRRALEVLYSEGADKVVMHAFDGKSSIAREAIKRGFYFSMPTSIAFSQQKQKLAKSIPIEYMVLETDSPVLSPIRGTVNEPANLIYALKKVAEIKKIPEHEVDRVTTYNAKKIFNIF